ncbi:helix-turn-helix transcriptional regulator [Paenibacillus faecis]|uniref:Helix-turn-helix transcriptional regulator n=2 Tax=Paenibacillus TaxID=44249 RepID=A0A5D0CRH2_9BACL|nr:helix-turn-helix transcriptional regulator [Paenibacillus faecis]
MCRSIGLPERQGPLPAFIRRMLNHGGCRGRNPTRVSGITIMEYVMKKRIEKAKQLLENTNYTITRIAVIIGFSSAAHFSTTFRKRLGISPSEYRTSYNAYNVCGGDLEKLVIE